MNVNVAETSLPPGPLDDVAAELVSVAFASLRRSDQRRKAESYVRGLLRVEGRKSIRRIAALTGDRAAEQSLQHFVSLSTWDWQGVRAALARHLERRLRPSAWVVRPMFIPKTGLHSAGVAQRLFPGSHQLVNCQEAYGLWLAGERASVPVHWRLHLPPAWLADEDRRRTADIPEDAAVELPAGSAAGTAVDVSAWWGLRRAPVVVEREADGEDIAAVSLLSRAGLRFLVRIAGDTEVSPLDAALSGYRHRPLPARHLLGAMRQLRRPVQWQDGATSLTHVSLVARVPVTVPVPPVAGTQDGRRTVPVRRLALLGEWERPYRWPVRFWLTDLAEVPVGEVLRLTKLVTRVDRDFNEISESVGVRDFEGRGFPGWHRHTTLASVAHAARLMAAPRSAHAAAAVAPCACPC